MFTDARAVSTPNVAIKTFDNASTIQGIRASLGGELAELTPFVSWDGIHGLKGLNDSGVEAVDAMCKKADGGAGVDRAATVDLTICLATLEEADEDVIAFIHNPQLFWDKDPRAIQGMWNLRDPNKAAGNMLVLLLGPGDELPAELQQDTLVLEEPLPTRDQLAKIVTDTYGYFAQKYPACKKGPSAEVLKAAVDALIGLPAFPADQAVAMCLDKATGILDIETLWARKRSIVSQNPGLSYHAGKEKLADMYGCAPIQAFGKAFMGGKFAPTLIVRMDEIEKQFAGAGTDSSGTKGNLLGEWLTWVNDKRIVCSLFVGVPGSSKSHSVYCIGGEYGRPVINYSIPGMEHEHVGMSSRHQRTAHRVLDAISDEKIWLIATANNIDGLPPELISRFQVGGIFFFDAPDSDEKQGIMKLKMKAYGLDANQDVPNMDDWTGRDVDNCARKALTLGIDLDNASKFIVPLLQSHGAQMDALRQSASGRFLAANKEGVYKYSPPVKKPIVTVTNPEGRKVR
jgi:hypothetical protein